MERSAGGEEVVINVESRQTSPEQVKNRYPDKSSRD
jgi:hypothetical protein